MGKAQQQKANPILQHWDQRTHLQNYILRILQIKLERRIYGGADSFWHCKKRHVEFLNVLKLGHSGK